MATKHLPPEVRRASMDDAFPPQRLQWAVAEASRCLMCDDPPCQKGCLAGVDIKRFIRALKNRNLRGAVSAIRDGNFYRDGQPVFLFGIEGTKYLGAWMHRILDIDLFEGHLGFHYGQATRVERTNGPGGRPAQPGSTSCPHQP